MTLTEFLLARIAEDEQAAHFEEYGMPIPGNSWGPERVLAECEARRRIVDMVTESESDFDGGYNYASEAAARVLAQPYADHPDFKPAWRIT